MRNPFVILICGGSCSGKTMLSNLLSDYLGETLVLSLDNYFIDYSLYSEEELEHINFDIPEAFQFEILLRNIFDILDEKSTMLPIYNFENHKIGQWEKYSERPKFIIIEGVMAFEQKELLEMASLKVFIDTPLDIMLWRRVSRDNVERFFDIKSTLNRYINFVRPSYEQLIYPKKILANVIIDGCSAFDRKVLDELAKKCNAYS